MGLVLYGLTALFLPSLAVVDFSDRVFRLPPATVEAGNNLTVRFQLLVYFNLVAGAAGLALINVWNRTRAA